MSLDHSSAATDRLPSTSAGDPPVPECREAVTNCWDYLDGNCAPGLSERLDGHFSRCPPCSRLRDLQERFFASLGAVRSRSAPPRLHDRVRRLLAAERQHYRPR